VLKIVIVAAESGKTAAKPSVDSKTTDARNRWFVLFRRTFTSAELDSRIVFLQIEASFVALLISFFCAELYHKARDDTTTYNDYLRGGKGKKGTDVDTRIFLSEPAFSMKDSGDTLDANSIAQNRHYVWNETSNCFRFPKTAVPGTARR
jgi:hypothetical protein